MKKTITTLFFIACSIISISQSLRVLDDIDSSDVSNTIYDIPIDCSAAASTGKEFLIKNNTNVMVDSVKVRAYLWTLDGGDQNQLCWGSVCEGFGITISSQRLNIDSMQIVTFGMNGFHATLNTTAVNLTRLVHYKFYLENNPTDSVGITIRYSCVNGIQENLHNAAFISNATPNPINGSSFIDYNIENHFNSAEIIFYDVLGNELKHLVLQDKQGREKINCNEFIPGIYFYSLLVDNQKLATKKFVVTSK